MSEEIINKLEQIMKGIVEEEKVYRFVSDVIPSLGVLYEFKFDDSDDSVFLYLSKGQKWNVFNKEKNVNLIRSNTSSMSVTPTRVKTTFCGLMVP